MISKDMSIGEIIQACPDSVEIMMSYGLHCIGCHVAHWETLEEGGRGHGKKNKKIANMLKDINEKCSK